MVVVGEETQNAKMIRGQRARLLTHKIHYECLQSFQLRRPQEIRSSKCRLSPLSKVIDQIELVYTKFGEYPVFGHGDNRC
jgi:hypothetical protein